MSSVRSSPISPPRLPSRPGSSTAGARHCTLCASIPVITRAIWRRNCSGPFTDKCERHDACYAGPPDRPRPKLGHEARKGIDVKVTVLEGGEVYAPEPLGRCDVLLIGETIAYIGALDIRAISALPFDVERVDCRGC